MKEYEIAKRTLELHKEWCRCDHGEKNFIVFCKKVVDGEIILFDQHPFFDEPIPSEPESEFLSVEVESINYLTKEEIIKELEEVGTDPEFFFPEDEEDEDE